jgi:hypothetical protein
MGVDILPKTVILAIKPTTFVDVAIRVEESSLELRLTFEPEALIEGTVII